jgi:hypothetical protein
VRRKTMSIALSMTSSLNVEEVAIFIKKSLHRRRKKRITTRYHFSALGGLFVLLTIHVDPGLGIQVAADSVHRHQIL